MKKRTAAKRPRYGSIPWSAARHKSRYSLAALIRREFEPDTLVDLDVLAQMPAPARRDLQDGRVG